MVTTGWKASACRTRRGHWKTYCTPIPAIRPAALFYPASEAAQDAIACQVELQRKAGGDALIGWRLSPLLREAGFADVTMSPRMIYVDRSRPALVDGFILRTFTAMIGGVRNAALEATMIGPARFDAGIAALRRTAEADGVFCCTFFKAVGLRA